MASQGDAKLPKQAGPPCRPAAGAAAAPRQARSTLPHWPGRGMEGRRRQPVSARTRSMQQAPRATPSGCNAQLFPPQPSPRPTGHVERAERRKLSKRRGSHRQMASGSAAPSPASPASALCAAALSAAPAPPPDTPAARGAWPPPPAAGTGGPPAAGQWACFHAPCGAEGLTGGVVGKALAWVCFICKATACLLSLRLAGMPRRCSLPHPQPSPNRQLHPCSLGISGLAACSVEAPLHMPVERLHAAVVSVA